MSGAPGPTAAWLVGLHAPLGERLLAAQFALLDRRPDRALLEVAGLRAALAAHIAGEDELLLPAYAAAVPTPGRGAGAEVFVAEHQKILRLAGEVEAALAAAGAGEVSHAEALRLLEAVHPLKGLLQHHEDREERLLAPALDEAIGDEALGLRARVEARMRAALMGG